MPRDRTESRMEVFGSGKAPEYRIMARAFRDYLEAARDDPEHEARYQAWLKDYRAKKGA